MQYSRAPTTVESSIKDENKISLTFSQLFYGIRNAISHVPAAQCVKRAFRLIVRSSTSCIHLRSTDTATGMSSLSRRSLAVKLRFGEISNYLRDTCTPSYFKFISILSNLRYRQIVSRISREQRAVFGISCKIHDSLKARLAEETRNSIAAIRNKHAHRQAAPCAHRSYVTRIHICDSSYIIVGALTHENTCDWRLSESRRFSDG